MKDTVEVPRAWFTRLRDLVTKAECSPHIWFPYLAGFVNSSVTMLDDQRIETTGWVGSVKRQK